jgi:hypothetical protein
MPAGRTTTRSIKRRSIGRIVLLGCFYLLLAVLILFMVYLIHQRITENRSPDMDAIAILAEQLPRTSGTVPASGIIEPKLDAVTADKGASLDLSGVSEGYLFFRYDGPHGFVGIQLCSVDREGAVHADNLSDRAEDRKTQDGLFPTYNYPSGSGWQGYVLPYGSGTYTVTVYPHDEGKWTSNTENISEFTFEANFEADAPYGYRNAYSYYDENSLAVAASAYLTAQEEASKGAPLTDREKTEVIVRFLRNNLSPDEALAVEPAGYAQDTYLFPDTDAALAAGSGYCNEKAALAAIMLKSQHIPVKIFHGDILRASVRGEEKERVYHAWIHVYLDGNWVMYDPTVFDGAVTDTVENGFGEYLTDTALVR